MTDERHLCTLQIDQNERRIQFLHGKQCIFTHLLLLICLFEILQDP